jgi:hypothetical protein
MMFTILPCLGFMTSFNLKHPLMRPLNLKHPLMRPLNLKHPLMRPLNLKHPLMRPLRLDGYALGKGGAVAVGRAVGSNWGLVDLDLELGYTPHSEENYLLQSGVQHVQQMDTLFLFMQN